MTEHEPTERALRAALSAAADSVRAGDLAPSELPSPPAAEPSSPRLLRTRRGVAAIAVTAIASGAAGAAAAAALPGDDHARSAPPPAAPSAASTPGPGVRQLDVDGDGEVDPVRVGDGRLLVRLSRTGSLDRLRIEGDRGQVLALHRTDTGVAVVYGAGPRAGRSPRYLGLAMLGKQGFIEGNLRDALSAITIVADRIGPQRLHIRVE